MKTDAFSALKASDSARVLRNQRRQARQRRELVSQAIVTGVNVSEAIGSASNEDSERLFAGDVKAARKVLNRALRRMDRVTTDHREPGGARFIQTPTHLLRKSHRPCVLPGLVPAERPSNSSTPFAVVLQELQVMLDAGQNSFAVLDWLCGTGGISWVQSTSILQSRGVPVSAEVREMTETARRFWEQLEVFQRVYSNAVQLRQIEAAAEGTWALVETGELSDWLPGIYIPKMHRRDQYLVRVKPRGGSLLRLDFFSRLYRPLFRVPV